MPANASKLCAEGLPSRVIPPNEHQRDAAERADAVRRHFDRLSALLQGASGSNNVCLPRNFTVMSMNHRWSKRAGDGKAAATEPKGAEEDAADRGTKGAAKDAADRGTKEAAKDATVVPKGAKKATDGPKGAEDAAAGAKGAKGSAAGPKVAKDAAVGPKGAEEDHPGPAGASKALSTAVGAQELVLHLVNNNCVLVVHVLSL